MHSSLKGNIMDSLKSLCYLINNNNGMFKSQKQATYINSFKEDGVLVSHGDCFNKSWIDFFETDDKGIIKWDRQMKSGKIVSKWNREGTSEEQVKNSKRLEKHKNNVSQHELISVEAEKLYNDLCMKEFGYLISRKKISDMCSMIQECQNFSILPYISSLTNVKLIEYALNKEIVDKQVNEMNELFKDISNKHLFIRCAVKEKYPSKFQFSFMDE